MVEEPRLQKLIRRLGNSSQTTRSGGSFLIDGGWRPWNWGRRTYFQTPSSPRWITPA